MGSHIVNGEFQSDKYPTCPAGKVPLSVKDPSAQPFLWGYAQVHRPVDAEFSDDLEAALIAADYDPRLRIGDDPVHLGSSLRQRLEEVSGELAEAKAEVVSLRAQLAEVQRLVEELKRQASDDWARTVDL